MANFIALTHLVNNKPAPVHVNVDQICEIGDAKALDAPEMAAAAKFVPMARGASARPKRVAEAAGTRRRPSSKQK